MQRAAVVSPFYKEAQGMPWITWTQRQPVTGLPDIAEDITGTQLEETGAIPEQETMRHAPSTAYVPQHHRYSAVVDKMKQASRKIGAYADWHT